MNEISTFQSDDDPKRWEWLWLTDLPDGFVVRSAFTFASEKSAKAAGKREVAKLIKYCSGLKSEAAHK